MQEPETPTKPTPEAEESEFTLQDLTAQQARFVLEYVKDPSSPAKAACRAGYSIESAKTTARNLLNNEKVKAAIADAHEWGVKKLGITAARVLQELALIAFSNPGDIITKDEDGQAHIDLQKVSKDGITEVNITSTSGRQKAKIVSVKTVKTSDKLAALEKLGKHLGMFKDEVKLDATGDLLSLINQSYALEKKPE